jgi:hypothetical protein
VCANGRISRTHLVGVVGVVGGGQLGFDVSFGVSFS